MRHFVVAAILAVSGVAACATSGSGPTSRSQPNLLTAEELESIPQLTAYQALERLRPRWLQTRRAVSVREAGPQRAEVVVDGIHVGGLDELRSIRVQEIHEVRFLSARDATSRYGTGFVAGVIEIRTRR